MEGLNANQLADSLMNTDARKDFAEPSSDEDDDSHLTPEALAKKKKFKSHRSKHYDEFTKVKMARELIAKELAELEDDDEDSSKMEMSPPKS